MHDYSIDYDKTLQNRCEMIAKGLADGSLTIIKSRGSYDADLAFCIKNANLETCRFGKLAATLFKNPCFY